MKKIKERNQNGRHLLIATLKKIMKWIKLVLFFVDSFPHCMDSLLLLLPHTLYVPRTSCSFPQLSPAFRKRFGFIYLYLC
jgi:hypothetical protein